MSASLASAAGGASPAAIYGGALIFGLVLTAGSFAWLWWTTNLLSGVLALATIVGLAILHGVLARAIMIPSREALLAEQARQSQAQRAGAVRAADVERTLPLRSIVAVAPAE